MNTFEARARATWAERLATAVLLKSASPEMTSTGKVELTKTEAAGMLSSLTKQEYQLFAYKYLGISPVDESIEIAIWERLYADKMPFAITPKQFKAMVETAMAECAYGRMSVRKLAQHTGMSRQVFLRLLPVYQSIASNLSRLDMQIEIKARSEMQVPNTI